MVKYFNNIFGASFSYYSNPKLNVFPRFGATMIVMLCQIMLLYLLFAVLKKITPYNIFMLFTNRIYFLIVLVLWGMLNVRYYSKVRTQRIIKEYEEKSNKEKKIWSAVTIISIIAPLISIAFLLKK